MGLNISPAQIPTTPKSYQKIQSPVLCKPFNNQHLENHTLRLTHANNKKNMHKNACTAKFSTIIISLFYYPINFQTSKTTIKNIKSVTITIRLNYITTLAIPDYNQSDNNYGEKIKNENYQNIIN